MYYILLIPSIIIITNIYIYLYTLTHESWSRWSRSVRILLRRRQTKSCDIMANSRRRRPVAYTKRKGEKINLFRHLLEMLLTTAMTRKCGVCVCKSIFEIAIYFLNYNFVRVPCVHKLRILRPSCFEHENFSRLINNFVAPT